MSTHIFAHARFDKLIADTVEQMNKLAVQKGGEYAGDQDRLANFRRNAAALDLRMEQIWAVYAGKHWDAVQQYIKDLATGKTRPRMESLDGRVDDLIVYLVLFKAILAESRDGSHGPQEA